MANAREMSVLRSLGSQVREISEQPQQQETIARWQDLNRLQPQRPMVLIDQIPWHEMDVDGELVLQCEDPFCRQLEWELRQILYKWKHMPVDMVVEPYLDIPIHILGMDYGITAQETVAVKDARNDVKGHFYHDQLQDEGDLEKIRMPQIRVDAEATERDLEQAHRIFDGVLFLRSQGKLPNFALWDRIVEWRGAQNVLLDLAVRPDFIHAIMERLTKALLSMVDQLEAQGLLPKSQLTTHCSGAHSTELPAPGYDPAQPRLKDLWTHGMAQIFASVSPAMHKEFELDYAREFYARSGLVYYGCCEPLDGKLDLIKDIPNLRKISMSPWVDQERGAAGIGSQFVFSRKPNPAFLAAPRWEPEVVAEDIRATMATAKRHGCPLEFILKDISTVNYEPQRLWQWAALVMELVQEA